MDEDILACIGQFCFDKQNLQTADIDFTFDEERFRLLVEVEDKEEATVVIAQIGGVVGREFTVNDGHYWDLENSRISFVQRT